MSKNPNGPAGTGQYDEASQFALMAERLHLFYPAEALTRMMPGDIVEAYDQAGRQRYRSFNSFEYCHYSLNELAATPWSELYSCSPEISARLRAAQARILGRSVELISLEDDLPAYLIEETRTPDRARFLVKERFAFGAVCGLNDEIYMVQVRRIRPA